MSVLRILMLGGALLVLRAADVGVSVAHMVGLSYPFLAHLGDRQGTIDLVLSIGADGSVRSIKTVSGDGLLAGGAAKELKAWTFSPCAHGGGDCQYPMSVRFVLQGGPVNISECKTEFQFDNPGKIVVISQHARAIAD